jgi:glycosyltransferase involved in cell wall biosynthesis
MRGRRPRRLGIYQDGPFRIVDSGSPPLLVPAPSDRAFLRFALEVGREFDSTVLFVRARHVVDRDGEDPLPPDVGFVELPYYESLVDLGQVARAVPGTIRAFWHGLDRVDAVWALGPHPFSLVLIALACLRRKRVVLGVRQDSLQYFRSRLRSGRGKSALLAARAWDLGYRALSRALATVVVGSDLERQYGGPRAHVLAINVSQIRTSDVVASPPRRDWDGAVRLLTVGRIDREKNPLLVVDMLARLLRDDPRTFFLTWIGSGPLESEVRRRATEVGVLERIELVGFVPFGPELLDLYRSAHIFVHVSLTEGVPATIIEALGSGTPVVATAVGGVAETLEHGDAGLLVPPSDLDSLVSAVERLAQDRELWHRLAAHGLSVASGRTLDVNASSVARFIESGSADRPAPVSDE